MQLSTEYKYLRRTEMLDFEQLEAELVTQKTSYQKFLETRQKFDNQADLFHWANLKFEKEEFIEFLSIKINNLTLQAL